MRRAESQHACVGKKPSDELKNSFSQVVVDAGSIMKVPESWKMVEAAGFMEVTLTAYLNIFQIGGAAKGKSA